MAEWPPVAPVKASLSPQEREKAYLQLVDMFVDIIEPDIIQMVLHNHNWDVDAALEDIMTLASPPEPNSAQQVNKTSNTPKVRNTPKDKMSTCRGPQDGNLSLNQLPPSYTPGRLFMNPQDGPQLKPKKQTPDKSFHYKTPDTKKGNQPQLLPFVEQYNYVKTTKAPFDRAVMMIKDGVKVCVILRGPPGSGKSYLARKLLLEGGIEPSAFKRHIFSTDEFFVQNNVYVFVPELLSQAHLWNQRSVAAAIREEISPVIVDNTNTQTWEMRVYAEMAVSAGYDLEIVEPETSWFNRESELAKRNVHGVPKAKIRQMLERYERNITPDVLMRQFDLRYQLSKAPPQPTRNCKWRDKLSNQRNNKPKKKKSDFNSKHQSNLDNINSKFKSSQINSSFTQEGNDFTCQNGSTSSFVFPQVSSNTKPSREERQIPSKMVTKGDTNTCYVNGESTKGAYLDESNTNKLFDSLVKSSDSFLKSFSEASKSSQDPVRVPEQSSNVSSSGISYHTNRNSFDFMAETKKLLEALNKPSSQDQSSNLTPNSFQSILEEKTMENVESPKTEMQTNILVCKESEIFLPVELGSNNISHPDQNFNLEKEGNLKSEDKIRIAHDLVDSVIERAITDTSGFKLIHSYTDKERKDDRGLSWDYVIVNTDNTFTYQRRDSIPLGLPVVITDNIGVSSSHVTDAISGDEETGYQSEVIDENIETFFSSDVESKSNSSEDESSKSDCEPQHCLNRFDNLTPNTGSGNVAEYQLDTVEVPVSGIGSESSEKYEEFHLDAVKMGSEDSDGNTEKSVETSNINDPNVFEMMKDILCTLGPLNEKYNNSSGGNVDGVSLEIKISNTSQDSSIPLNTDQYVNSSAIHIADSFSNRSVGSNWGSSVSHSNVESQPKPPRNLKRSPLLSHAENHNFNDYSKFFRNWETVSNAEETWGMENTIKSSIPKTEAAVLPQRSSPNRSRTKKETTDASTNTNYLDFSLGCSENPTGVKILIGNINNIFPENVPEVKQNIVETLFLDKSTMTSDESTTSVGYDISQISLLFPNIPEKYILDIVERCQGDIDWAVDVLLDSEHIIAPVSIESKENSCDDGVEIDTTQFENNSSQKAPIDTIPNQESKGPTDEQIELKKLIESSVVIDKSHYSDKVLKVLKRKHPEYFHLKENNLPPEEKNVDRSEISEDSQDGCKTEDEVDEVEEESSSSGCEVETEDNTMDLVMSSDLIIQLQQKFGTSSLPRIADMTPIVKLPLSFARQLFGYIMDSLQSDMDEQQSLIEDMISRDEEVARLLQFQDQNSRPQLQEVMDMEIALAMHKADQEEWKERESETLAAKLSKNILLEKFPHVDPKMLAEILQAHNYSLSDTIASLTLGMGIGPSDNTATEPPKPPKEEKERVTSIIVSDDIAGGAAAAAGSVANPVSEAKVHRAQAASYYSLRMECLSKAHDALRSGNKTVATYYSQLAQLHRERMEQSNSKAAACLFSSHKTGANTLDLHFLHIREAEVVLDMFLDEVVTYISERKKRHQTVFLITGRGLRSVGGVSRIKPMVQRKLQGRGIPYNEVNPGMLSALVRNVTPLSYTL